MKLFSRILLFILISVSSLFQFCRNERRETLTFPYSQWTRGTSANNVSWRFTEEIEYNNSFIKTPEDQDWEVWYESIVEYRKKIGKI